MDNSLLVTTHPKLQKHILLFLIISEFVTLLLLVNNFLGIYSLQTSIILTVFMVLLCVAFDYYLLDKVKREFFQLTDEFLATNQLSCEWSYIEEVKFREENGKIMFLILKIEGEYHKLSLRLFQHEIDSIVEYIETKKVER